MNERIRELVKQSGLDYDELWTKDQMAVDKFAELIVRECSRIADDWVNNYNDGENYPSEMIKQRFGVEK